MSEFEEMWRVEGHPLRIVKAILRRKVLTVVLRHREAAGDDLVTVAMTPSKESRSEYCPHTIFDGCTRDGWIQLNPSAKYLFEVNERGFSDETKTWSLVKVSFDASRWWRVVPSFKSWSRQGMKQKANLLDCMPCELCWFSREAQAFFFAVYGALKALPSDLVDAYVLTHLNSNDIPQ